MSEGLIYLRDKNNTEISFSIKRENITTERNFKINEQEMYSNNSTHHTTNFYHNGSDGLSFKVTALFLKSEQDKITLLDAWYREIHSFSLVFDKSINLKLPLVSKKWIITKISASQEMDNLTEWDITFRTYNPPKTIEKVQNELVNRTSKSYKWKTKCKKTYKNLTYKKMKKKKGNDCAKLLNSILIEMGYMKKATKKVKTGKKDKKGKIIYKKQKYIPNKCTKSTSKAVKKFKKEWNKYKLKPAFKKLTSDELGKTGFENISNYKKLKSAKKKK